MTDAKLFAGRFRIESRIGRGGMGEVYKAFDEREKRVVALKVLKGEAAASESLGDRFARELQATWMVRHPNVVQVLSSGFGEGGRLYLAMELLDGRTLAATLSAGGALEPRRAVRVAAQVADALGAAHAQGIVHRDLKPENVMLLARPGADEQVKVLDFGLVRFFGEAKEGNPTLTTTGMLLGTAAYMSPEQALGRTVDARSDVYGLGVVLFEMLTGRVPFPQKNPLQQLRAQERDPPPRPTSLKSDVPAVLEALVLGMLEKDPARRPPAAAEVARALRAASW